MGSETPLPPKIPVIDFSAKGDKGSDGWISTRDNVVRALEEYGFFEAINDDDDASRMELRDKIYPAVQEFFDLPLETKVKYFFPEFIGMDGYAKPLEVSPLRQSVGIREPTLLEKVQSFTDLMWPSSNKFVCDTIHSYSKQLEEMDKMVKAMVFEHYGVEKYLDAHMKATSYSLRCTKYTEPIKEEKEVGLRKHVDPGVLTILQQNGVNGLQMQVRDGTWIDVEPSSQRSSFIVLAGYGLMASVKLKLTKLTEILVGANVDAYVDMALSNGRIHAPPHQVLMTGGKTRYSVGMFTFLDDILETPEELIDDEHPPLFKPFNNLQSMLSFLRATNEKQLQLGVDNQLTSV